MSAKSKPGILAFVITGAACFLSFFWNLGGYGIFDLDEGLYVEVAREMNLRGDYVTPRVNGTPFYDKPPLVYWLSAISQRMLGRDEFAARLPAAAASVLLAFLALLFGSRVFNPGTGQLAALSFALSPLVFGSGRQLTMDAVLSLFIACALYSFFRSEISADRGGPWLAGFWLCCALATLSKGAPGIVIPLSVALVYLLISRGPVAGIRRFFTGTGMLFGIPIFLAIVLPWHCAAWQANGKPFVDEYLIRQHFGRFRGGDAAHRAPFWFFVPGFILGFFPWSVFTVPALVERSTRGDRQSRSPADLARLLCKVWFVFVLVLFSASGSKLISYILPLYFPAALLGADWAVRSAALKENRGRLTLALGAAAVVSLAAFLGMALHKQVIVQIEAATHRPVSMRDVTPEMIQFLTWLTCSAAVATVTAWMLSLRLKGSLPFLILTAGMAVFFGIAVLLGFPAVDSTLMAPLHRITTFVGQEAGPDEKIVILASSRRPSALFYLPDRFLPSREKMSSDVVEISGLDSAKTQLPSKPFLLVFPLGEASRFEETGAVLGANRSWMALRIK